MRPTTRRTGKREEHPPAADHPTHGRQRKAHHFSRRPHDPAEGRRGRHHRAADVPTHGKKKKKHHPPTGARHKSKQESSTSGQQTDGDSHAPSATTCPPKRNWWGMGTGSIVPPPQEKGEEKTPTRTSTGKTHTPETNETATHGARLGCPRREGRDGNSPPSPLYTPPVCSQTPLRAAGPRGVPDRAMWEGVWGTQVSSPPPRSGVATRRRKRRHRNPSPSPYVSLTILGQIFSSTQSGASVTSLRHSHPRPPPEEVQSRHPLKICKRQMIGRPQGRLDC